MADAAGSWPPLIAVVQGGTAGPPRARRLTVGDDSRCPDDVLLRRSRHGVAYCMIYPAVIEMCPLEIRRHLTSAAGDDGLEKTVLSSPKYLPTVLQGVIYLWALGRKPDR